MDNTYFSSETSNLFKADQEMYEPNTSTVVKPLEDTVSEQRETEDRLSSILKELVKIQKEDRADDRMGNKKFLLSLLPFMEKLPDDVNLEVRLQLMSILQTYSSGESFMKT
jgi:thioredoxin-like negative regulator of GroEL